MRRALSPVLVLVLGCAGSDPTAAPAEPVTDATTADTSGTSGTPDTAPPVTCVPTRHCDDGNPCTYDDRCTAGLCAGTAVDCDDHRQCTLDQCDGKGGCLHEVAEGTCLLGNVCLPDGATNPNNGCEACDSAKSRIAWSIRAEQSACDDKNPCTFADYCKKGVCKKGVARTCDDENPCTGDDCDPGLPDGCRHLPISGACDDHEPCTEGSVCLAGLCRSGKTACDDGNACTTDTCLPDTGCAHVAVPDGTACTDGNACTADDGCTTGACVAGPKPNCDDASPCTNDDCDEIFGCFHTLTLDPCCTGLENVGDDKNPCTVDACGAAGGCTHQQATSPCDDLDPCTKGDACAGGACVSGGPNTCDDKNPCTDDSCNPATGCQHQAAAGACDDGLACTTGDACVGGSCQGDTSKCVCQPTFATTVAKLATLVMGDSGTPGQGLDVDQKATTCAPADSCSGGIDNSLAPLSGILNQNLGKALAAGQLILLLELQSPKTDGTPFPLALYAAKLKNAGCDVTHDVCQYLVEKTTVGTDCKPLVVLNNAKIVGKKLTAGGPGTNFPFSITLFGDTVLQVTLYNGQIVGDVSLDASGTQVTGIANGLLGGGISKKAISTALEQVPDEQLPIPKAQIAPILDLLIVEDLDTKPPAGPDAASAGFRFDAIGAVIVWVKN